MYNSFLLLAVNSLQIPEGRFSFIQIIHENGKNSMEYSPLVSQSAAFISVNTFSNYTASLLARSPPTLILLIRPTTATLAVFIGLTRHVIMVLGVDCNLVQPSNWGVGIYCEDEDGFVENYTVGDQTIRQLSFIEYFFLQNYRKCNFFTKLIKLSY
jgi:hypothetical protein